MQQFNKLIQAQFNKMCATGKLFRSSLTGNQVWDLYINSFKPEDNPIFRDPNSTVHNCNLCKNFIRRYGNIVAITENNNIATIWDVDDFDGEYVIPAHNIRTALHSAKISEVFFETFNELNSLPYESCTKKNEVFKLGVDKNVKRYTKEEAEKYGVVKPNEIRTFNHIHLFLPKQFVDMGSKSIEAIMADYRSAKEVFQRAMEEISLDTLQLVRDLIIQGSLLDGQTHLYKVEQIIVLKGIYDTIEPSKKDNWCWVASYKFPLAKFKNELIGVLCSELAQGEEINKACQSWNKRVDPANYMKAVAPITKFQIQEAQKFVEENGYEESFNRRFATLDDIKVSEILHVNVGDEKIKNVSIFDKVQSAPTRHKRNEFDGIEEVTIEKFMNEILPNCTSVEVFLQNKHEDNLVSLTTANNKESKPIFKWSNNYSWTFNGNLAGKSMIKDAVKSRGGKTEAEIRVSMFFPNTTDDYDLHLTEPGNYDVYYGNRRSLSPCGGMLDLDAQGVDGHQPPDKRVENITYVDKSKLKKGTYSIYMKNYTGRGLHTKFQIEIEIDSEVTLLELAKTNASNNTHIAYINYNGSELELNIDPAMTILDSKSVSKEIYGLETNNFHKVNLICLSPNHWDNNNVGNKHYFFMLDKCKCPQSIRSFHAENLIPELANHRKVLEVLGNTTMIAPTDNKRILNGLGFNATVREELIVRLQGSFKRVIKIKF